LFVLRNKFSNNAHHRPLNIFSFLVGLATDASLKYFDANSYHTKVSMGTHRIRLGTDMRLAFLINQFTLNSILFHHRSLCLRDRNPSRSPFSWQLSAKPLLGRNLKGDQQSRTAVLRCSKTLYNWDQHGTEDDKKQSLYEMIAKDKES
jgi:hypothetical protein